MLKPCILAVVVAAGELLLLVWVYVV